jgi:hypothetical protein
MDHTISTEELKTLRLLVNLSDDDELSLSLSHLLLTHLINAQHLWNKRIVSEELVYGIWEMLPFEKLHEINLENFEISKKILATEDLERIIFYKNIKGKDFKRIITIKKDGKICQLPEKTILLTAISKPKRLLEYLPKNRTVQKYSISFGRVFQANQVDLLKLFDKISAKTLVELYAIPCILNINTLIIQSLCTVSFLDLELRLVLL